MKQILLALGAELLAAGYARGQYIPPDFYLEKYQPSIGFWDNNGQVIDTNGDPCDDVEFYSTGSIPQLYLQTKSTVSFVLHVADTVIATTDTIYHLRMEPIGSNAADVTPVGTVLKDSHLNYHLPHCGVNGITGVEGYSRVLYENIFPFIDLHFYSGGFGQKMALVCRPGSNPDDIQLGFTGQDSLNEDLWGNLKFYHDGTHFVLPHAIAYQVNGDGSTPPVGWDAAYEADGDAGTVKFNWSSYDPDKPLVFLVGPPPAMGGDPVNTPGVCWGTYLGGDGGDRIYASDTDEEGNYYVGGFTYSQAIHFPIQTGVVYYEASPVAFVSKFGTGYESRWSTFYGGSSGIQWVRGLAVRPGQDPSILIGGRTEADDLWSWDPQDGSYFDGTSTSGGGFLAELDDQGVGIWSTYFGNGDISVLNIDLHSTGLIAVVGSTKGPLPPEQDTAPVNAEHWSYQGPSGLFGGDGWIALLKAERRTFWTTHVGGAARDMLRSVKFGDEKIVALGESESSNFPTQDGGVGAYDMGHFGATDAVIIEFDLLGDLHWGTYLGASGHETPGYHGLAIRSSTPGIEDIYMVGKTSSADLDIVEGPNWFDDTYKPGQGFIARLSGVDRSIQWLSYVNGNGEDVGETYLEAITLDKVDRIYVGGYSTDTSFPFESAWNLYSTYDTHGIWDGVLMCFSNEQELRWSTFFGGDESGEQGERIETITAWSDKRFYAAGFTYTSFNDQNFFPFTDPVGDTDYFDEVLYPQWDGFIAAFCTDGLLTSANDIVQSSGFSARHVALGVYELTGLPCTVSVVRVIDPAGRVIQQLESRTGNGQLHIDLSGAAPGVYVVHVSESGAIRLIKEL